MKIKSILFFGFLFIFVIPLSQVLALDSVEKIDELKTNSLKSELSSLQSSYAEYYLSFDLNNPVIRMYEETSDDVISYKYEALNGSTFDKGFNTFYDKDGSSYLFYLLDNNKIARGIYKINKKYYYFDDIGIKREGIINYSGNIYLILNGVMYKDKLVTYGGKKYYFKSDGKAYKGFKIINNKRYYFNSNGVSTTGFIKFKGKYYYLKNYKLKRNVLLKINGKYYYFGKNGYSIKGWKTIGKYKYYFKSDYTGATYVNKIGSYRYYFNKYGHMFKKALITYNGNKYYALSNGHLAKGFITYKKKLYYFSYSDCHSITGLVKKSGNYYYLKDYKLKKNAWIKISGNYYYFNKNGIAYKNGIYTIKDVKYKFLSDSKAVSGYYTEGVSTYYKDASGKLLKGFKYVFGVKKYFSNKGELISYDNQVIDVSSWQGVIDWSKVKVTNIKGAIIRIGFTGSESKKSVEDTYIKENINGALSNGIPIGIYYYGYAKTVSAAKKEAEFVISTLKKYGNPTLTYPIFYDAEEASIGKANYEKVIPAFIDTLTAAGYNAGVYGNAYAFYSSYLNSSIIKKYPMWVAHYNTSCSSHYVSSDYCGYKQAYGWQYTSSGSVPGITGKVDMSYWYRTK